MATPSRVDHATAALEETILLRGRHALLLVELDNRQEQFPTLAPTQLDLKQLLVPTAMDTMALGLLGLNAQLHVVVEFNKDDEFTHVAKMTTFKNDLATTTSATGKPGLTGPTVPSHAVVATLSELAITVALAKWNQTPNSVIPIRVHTTVPGPTGVPARPVAVLVQCLECDTAMAVESALVSALMVTLQHLKQFNATWATAVTLTGVVGLVVAAIHVAVMSDFASAVAAQTIQLKKCLNHVTRVASSVIHVLL